eukprot:PhM_4_TR266/c0_g1_i2/m.1609
MSDLFMTHLFGMLGGGYSAADYNIPHRREMNPQGKSHPKMDGTECTVVTSNIDVKPLRPLTHYPRLPILHTSELELNSWHAGRYIEGTLSSFSNRSGVFSRNICICCRHRDGTLFAVFVACAHPDDMHAMLGKTVRINDPYYRIDASGTRTIRVDSPADIFFFEGTTPLSVERGKSIGDSALRNDKPIEALTSYWKVLRNPN